MPALLSLTLTKRIDEKRAAVQANDPEKSVGEILDAWSELCPPLERERAQYDEDEPVPMHP